MKEIKEGQNWKYVGPGTGNGLIHLVTMMEKDWSDGLMWVYTWSRPITSTDIGGFTWKGPINVFAREFSPQ